MKIVMLGPTGVGKTTYMASVYGELQREVKGFTLRATDPEERKNLLGLADNVLRGKYPAATNQRSEYQFELRYEGKTVLPITWADYPGEALLETQSSQQAQSLAGDLRDADGLMMFCDCEALAQNPNSSKDLGRMVRLVSYAVEQSNKSLCLSVVLTKSDTINQFSPEILYPFQGLISAIEASDCIDCVFIPVACSNRIVNVTLPLFFVIQAKVARSVYLWPFSFLRTLINPRESLDSVDLVHLHENYLEIVKSLSVVVSGLPKVCSGRTLKEYNNQIEDARLGRSVYQTSSRLNSPLFDPFREFE